MDRCPSCGEEKPDVEEQYSFGIYAGKMCSDCAKSKYRDGCGLIDGMQGSQADLDEQIEPDDGEDWTRNDPEGSSYY